LNESKIEFTSVPLTRPRFS